VRGYDLVGRTFGTRYRIGDLIAAEPWGYVYGGDDLTTLEKIAVQVLEPEFAEGVMAKHAFEHHAYIAAQLRQENLLRVNGYGTEDGRFFVVSEQWNATPLADLVRSPLDGTTTRGLMSGALGGLAAIHGVKACFHGNFRLENILVMRDAKVKVRGFATGAVIAARARDRMRDISGDLGLITLGTSVGGPPSYLSPEECKGGNVDARTDVYAAGVILFVLLTGRFPFEAESRVDAIHRALKEQPRDPRTIAVHADPALAAICLRALKKEPRERFQDALEMLRALRGA